MPAVTVAHVAKVAPTTPNAPPKVIGALAPRIDQPSKRELDNAHIAQVQNDRYLPNGKPWPTNQCGPTAAVNAVRLMGADVPGFKGERTREVLVAARMIATNEKVDRGTYPHELARIVRAAGVTPVPAYSTDSILARARRGVPTIILGDANATGGFDSRTSEPKSKGESWGHFVTVSGYDKRRGEYFVDDPGAAGGTQYAPASEIRAFKKGWDYAPDVSLVREGGKLPVVEPPPVKVVHSRKGLKAAEKRARATLTEHDTTSPNAPKNPAQWDRLVAARVRTPVKIPYSAKAYYRVLPEKLPRTTAADTRIAAVQTARAMLGKEVKRSTPRSFNSLLAQVREGKMALVRGNAARKGAWDDESVQPRESRPSWALVAGYLPESKEYIVDDPRQSSPMHVPASELRAFDRGAAGENVVLIPAK